MFDTRNNQEIYYSYLGVSNNMPIGNEPKNGDSVILKFKEYIVDVENIKTIEKSNYSGLVDSITETKTDKEIPKIKEINLNVGDTVTFSIRQIFACTRTA